MVNSEYKKAVENFLMVRESFNKKGFETAFRYCFSLPLCFYLLNNKEEAEKEIVRVVEMSSKQNGYFDIYKENVRKEFQNKCGIKNRGGELSMKK